MAKSAAKPAAIDATMRIVVFYGPERFLIEEFTRRFAEMLQEKFGGLEVFNFDGETVEPAAVLDELRSYGLMQKHKLVILDDADTFLAGKKSKGDEEDEDEDSGGSRRPLMERYAEHPSPDATLVMRAESWRKGKLDKLIEKVGCIRPCEEVDDASAINWCLGRCGKRYNVTMDRDAAALLVERIGPQLLHLDTELMKLVTMVEPGQPITKAVVVEAVGMSREEKAWEIQSAILTGDSSLMFQKLHELLEVSRHDLVPITWAIVDVLRKLHAASQLLRRRVPPEGVQKTLRIWGDNGMVVRLAAKGRPQDFAQLLRDAIQVDQFAKSGVGEPRRNVEGLMVRIADTLTPRSHVAA